MPAPSAAPGNDDSTSWWGATIRGAINYACLGYGDEVRAHVREWTGDGKYEDNLKESQALTQKTRAEHETAYKAGEWLGGIGAAYVGTQVLSGMAAAGAYFGLGAVASVAVIGGVAAGIGYPLVMKLTTGQSFGDSYQQEWGVAQHTFDSVWDWGAGVVNWAFSTDAKLRSGNINPPNGNQKNSTSPGPAQTKPGNAPQVRPQPKAQTVPSSKLPADVVKSDNAAPPTTPDHAFDASKPPVNEVHFAFDKNTLTDADKAAIKADVDDWKAHGDGRHITVTGHTDTMGTNSYNDALSIRRADAVKSEMVADGVDASMIDVKGAGEAQLEIKTADETRNAVNRSATIDYGAKQPAAPPPQQTQAAPPPAPKAETPPPAPQTTEQPPAPMGEEVMVGGPVFVEGGGVWVHGRAPYWHGGGRRELWRDHDCDHRGAYPNGGDPYHPNRGNPRDYPNGGDPYENRGQQHSSWGGGLRGRFGGPRGGGGFGHGGGGGHH